VGVDTTWVGEAGVLTQADGKTSRANMNMLATRRKRWNMLAVDGVMVIGAPIIAQANPEKSLIHEGQLVL
jgi:hypothetical protein